MRAPLRLRQLPYPSAMPLQVRVYNTKARQRRPAGQYGNETKMVTLCKLGACRALP